MNSEESVSVEHHEDPDSPQGSSRAPSPAPVPVPDHEVDEEEEEARAQEQEPSRHHHTGITNIIGSLLKPTRSKSKVEVPDNSPSPPNANTSGTQIVFNKERGYSTQSTTQVGC